MMKTMQKNVLAIAVLAATSLPAMAAGVDVGVKGSVTPAACIPALSGAGVIDYGNIEAKSLSPDSYTLLDAKTVGLTITCTAPTLVAIKGINNRAGTNASDVEGVGGGAVSPAGLQFFGSSLSQAVAGLGLDGTSKVGGYAVRMHLVAGQIDGADADTKISTDLTNPAGWTPGVSQPLFGTTQVNYMSWSARGAQGVTPFTTFQGDFDIQAYINKTSELDMTKPIVLDGSATIELVYL